MTDLRLPCREGNSDDWFIDRHGKQYADEELLTEEVREAIHTEAERLELVGEDRVEFVEKAENRAEADARRDALRTRRQAKQACHDCLLRTRCLEAAIDGDIQHGTWGGYYEEEIKEIRREIARRKRARKG